MACLAVSYVVKSVEKDHSNWKVRPVYGSIGNIKITKGSVRRQGSREGPGEVTSNIYRKLKEKKQFIYIFFVKHDLLFTIKFELERIEIGPRTIHRQRNYGTINNNFLAADKFKASGFQYYYAGS